VSARSAFIVSFGIWAALSGAETKAQDIYYAVRTTTSFGVDGERDLGLSDSDRNDHFQLNLAPRALIAFNSALTGYFRGRVFLPTSGAAPFDLDQPDDARASKGFAGLNELWVQYNGITSYPGEAVRIGRQRIRQGDGEWWDQDADSLRWFLDTTLRSAEIGVAHQFSTYRTDSVDVPIEQRGRTYIFVDIATRWRVDNRLGLRATHAIDHGRLPEIDQAVSADEKLERSQLTWIGVFADNGFYEMIESDRSLAYTLEATYVIGSQDVATRDAGSAIASHLSQTVGAWNGSVGLRWQPLANVPLQLGAAYTYSQGGAEGDRSTQYQQSGMQSNSSYFTGTQTLTSRYNEMLQPELGNLRIATAFLSLNLTNQTLGLVFEEFRKDDGAAPIRTRNVTANTVGDSTDIGTGVDLVFAHYFGLAPPARRLLESGDAFRAQERRSLIALRASLFRPGDAYAPEAKTVYRLMLEATLWWD
jgi:alginate production protein